MPNLNEAIWPLRLIFWGTLICVIDISYTETLRASGKLIAGTRFDFVNDVVGCIMIAVGVNKLRKYPVSDRYSTWMTFAFWVSVIDCFGAVHEHFLYPKSVPWVFVLGVYGLVQLIALLMFCECMRLWSEAFHLDRSTKSWLWTCRLVAWIFAVPIGLVWWISIPMIVSGEHVSIHDSHSQFIFLLVVLTFVPLVHGLVSLSRTIWDVQARDGASADIASDTPETYNPVDPADFDPTRDSWPQ
jgi:hypothetical protein